MNSKPIWVPKNNKTLLDDYLTFLKKKNLKSYNKLWSWSVNNKEKFWESIWKFSKVKGELKLPIFKKNEKFKDSIFFENSRINYVENLIKKESNDTAISFYSENNTKRKYSWNELNNSINKTSNFFTKNGIKKNDRIVGVLPNIPETIISFLATAKIGAIWSSCSADFGEEAIIERFNQIKPKILIISDCYFYNNKKYNIINKITFVIKRIKSIKKIIIIPFDGKKLRYVPNFKFVEWNYIMKNKVKKNKYKLFNFNHPLYILFTSGTTGKPKCIVHGAGGSLIQHMKEHKLHCNINENDSVMYFTTCGWMMWNWLVSVLACNAKIVLFDGSPFYPKKDVLFKIIEKENITFFGTGAKYIDSLKNNQLNIKNKYKLKKLKTIASTGSPLSDDSYKYVYNNIKKNIHLASISGGTDIVSCFVLGNPKMKVYPGEIQVKGLGMDIDVFDNNGNSLINKKGELVCKSPFPSKPLYFWNDKYNKLYNKSYFSVYKNIWHHGDYAQITKNNGIIIHGRSDATLNSGGIRIGTAEIYRIVESIIEVTECLVTELILKYDTKMIMFIKLKEKKTLNKKLIKIIRDKIKKSLSPRHVPYKLFQVNDIPKTKSGKIVELTVKKIINKEKVENINSLINPESLNEYIKIRNLI